MLTRSINPVISDIFDIPTQVHQGDFVVKLSNALADPNEALRQYVVTPQLARAFDSALGLIKASIASNSSKAAYLHGSFGSGKSHFMAVLTQILEGNPVARAIPELADVVDKHNDWSLSRKVLIVPYHLIGAKSIEGAVLGGYARYIRERHPDTPTPGFYRSETLFEDARNLRAQLGDDKFFAKLSGGEALSGWGNLNSWDATRFEAALESEPNSPERILLVSRLVDAYFQSARAASSDGEESYVSIDQGLAVLSQHAKSLGYDAVVLFLDELILWLASHAADPAFISREAQKVPKLVEAADANRPIPIVSFIARQRDLRELMGQHMPGAEKESISDILSYWEGRFDTITLEDRNLPAIAKKRLLVPKSDEARARLEAAFSDTAKVRQEVMSILLTHEGNQDDFQQLYPFSPALVQALVALSNVLQRERTALKLLQQLLVNARDTLVLGNIVPVGDLFDVIMGGDDPTGEGWKLAFENARKLYRQKFLPLLQNEHGVSEEDMLSGKADPDKARLFTNDARLVKTLLLSALVPGVEALSALTPTKLAALNHGTIKSPIPGREAQAVLQKLQRWAGQVGEIKLSDDSKIVSIHLVGVDTDVILENARNNDTYGARIQRVRRFVFEELGLEPDSGRLSEFEELEIVWKGTRRKVQVIYANVREMHLDTFQNSGDGWRVVIDFPFDKDHRTPKDDFAKVEAFQEEQEANTLVWLPSFFNERAMADLGKLVLLDFVLQGNNLQTHSSHLSNNEREQARQLLINQRDQLKTRLKAGLLEAYGVARLNTGLIDDPLEASIQFLSLKRGLKLHPPVGATLRESMDHLLGQALSSQFPRHPDFKLEIRPALVRNIAQLMAAAIQAPEGRFEIIDKAKREEVRQVCVPLELGQMGETHFVVGQVWKSHFAQMQAKAGTPNVSVKQLREWIDDPMPRGLPRDLQNLVILFFAHQTNRTFHVNGIAIEGSLERLDDHWELREQPLPDAAEWQRACAVAAKLLGVTTTGLLNASSVAKLIGDAQVKAHDAMGKADRVLKALEERLANTGISFEEAPRLETARASRNLLSSVIGAKADKVVTTLATAPIATSEAAMLRHLASADEVAGTLHDNAFKTFHSLANLSDERQEQAEAILARLAEALREDEYVLPLKKTVQEVLDEALDLLSKTVPLPPVKPKPPKPGLTKIKEAQHRQAKGSEVKSLLIDLLDQVERDGELVVDLEVHVYKAQ